MYIKLVCKVEDVIVVRIKTSRKMYSSYYDNEQLVHEANMLDKTIMQVLDQRSDYIFVVFFSGNKGVIDKTDC